MLEEVAVRKQVALKGLLRMILLVNMGQENRRRNRNEKPQSVEDGERVADSNLCQRGKQHQYRAEQNSHTAIRGCRTHTCLNHTTFQGWNSGWHLKRPVEACRQMPSCETWPPPKALAWP